MILLLMISVAACSSKETAVPEKVEADIQLPKAISLNEEISLKVKVSQGDTAVTDADEVKFEIWNHDDKNDSKMMEATNEGNGIYTIKETFKEDGIYFVQTHVTARDMHVMPKKKFAVGEVSAEEMKSEESEGEHHSSHH